jgi:hypothetical protein
MTTHTIPTRKVWTAIAALSAADCLCLAAAPIFAVMALVVGISRDDARTMICMAAHSPSPFGGMAWMYLLMSAFHTAPWLKLISGRPSHAAPGSSIS